jgi:hypothetical protein
MGDRQLQLERARMARFERVLFTLMSRLHRDTECGRNGEHWRECEAVFRELGWSGYESYAAEMRKLYAKDAVQRMDRPRALATEHH